MNQVVFDTITFTKASVLAKEFGYTADYLGQLCRSGKVTARLVGRTWYVDRTSLETHRDGRYQVQRHKSRPDDIINKIEVSDGVSRIQVEPVVTSRQAKHYYAHGTNPSLQLSKAVPRYEIDQSPLMPQVHSSVPVRLADAHILPITKSSPVVTELKPEALPVVYMHGVLSVTAIPEEEVVSEPVQTLTSESTVPKKVSSHSSVSSFPNNSVSSQMVKSSLVARSIVHEVPIRPLEVIISRPVVISVVAALVLSFMILEINIVAVINAVSQTMWQLNFAALGSSFLR